MLEKVQKKQFPMEKIRRCVVSEDSPICAVLAFGRLVSLSGRFPGMAQDLRTYANLKAYQGRSTQQ